MPRLLALPRTPTLLSMLDACEEAGQAVFVGAVNGGGVAIHIGAIRGARLFAAGQLVAVRTVRSREEREPQIVAELREVGALSVAVLRYKGGRVAVRGSVAEIVLQDGETLLDAYHRIAVPQGELRTHSVGGFVVGYRDGEVQIGSEATGVKSGLRVSLPKEEELRNVAGSAIKAFAKAMR